MYAEDTISPHSSKCLSSLWKNLNGDLVNLLDWLHGNEASLIISKAQSVIIGSRPYILKIQTD